MKTIRIGSGAGYAGDRLEPSLDSLVPALQGMTAENEVQLLASCLYQRVDYKKSISEGKGVMEYAAGGKAAQEMRALHEEIEQLLQAGS